MPDFIRLLTMKNAVVISIKNTAKGTGMLRFGISALTLVLFSATAFSGEIPPTPLPLAGVTGPIGIAIAGAVYAGYRVYRHYLIKR